MLAYCIMADNLTFDSKMLPNLRKFWGLILIINLLYMWSIILDKRISLTVEHLLDQHSLVSNIDFSLQL